MGCRVRELLRIPDMGVQCEGVAGGPGMGVPGVRNAGRGGCRMRGLPGVPEVEVQGEECGERAGRLGSRP